MEESKVQALHDTLSKLKKSQGLGISSHYNFGKVKTTEIDGKIVRTDGLPNNPLYFPFVREGTYDRNKSDASKYGDGRVIKRNFDDCNSDSDGGKKKKSKEERKAEKKAAKLEAKRQAKLEEKRRAKKEERRLAKLNSTTSEATPTDDDNKKAKKSKKRKVSDSDKSDNEAEKKKAKKKKSKKSKS